ncbi:hypothetical protein [Hominenteromicrobium sp.]|uniref:hypothetical protein n=1 Tax=Hominenteromicrobium sp. TaxID=3073581 RepID=UPI00399BDF52
MKNCAKRCDVIAARGLVSRHAARNLLWGNKNANDEEMQAAVKAAQAADFVQT